MVTELLRRPDLGAGDVQLKTSCPRCGAMGLWSIVVASRTEFKGLGPRRARVLPVEGGSRIHAPTREGDGDHDPCVGCAPDPGCRVCGEKDGKHHPGCSAKPRKVDHAKKAREDEWSSIQERRKSADPIVRAGAERAMHLWQQQQAAQQRRVR